MRISVAAGRRGFGTEGRSRTGGEGLEQTRPAGNAAHPAPGAAILDLRPRAIWTAFWHQSPAFWALNFFLLIEYVRPQSVWPALDVLPWGQVSLGMACLTVLTEPRVHRRFFFLDGLFAGFTLVLLASLVGAYDLSFGLQELSTFVNWAILYYLVTRIVTSEIRLFLFVAAFFLWSFKMSQFGARAFISLGFGFRDWGVGGGPGWFQNSGEFAIQMCVLLAMSLPVVIALRSRWPRWKLFLLAGLPLSAAVAVIASSSRGGQLGAAAVLLFFVALSRHRVRGLFWAFVVLTGLWFIVPAEQKARFTQMGDDNSSVTRMTYWRHGLEIMRDYPLLGVGYHNWEPYYRRFYNPQGQYPHNNFIEGGAQMGYVGLIAFVLLIIGTFVANARTRRMSMVLPDWGPFYRSLAIGLDAALVGYLVAGFFVTVLFYPFFWVNLCFTSALFLLVERRVTGLRRLSSGRSRAQVSPAIGRGVMQPT